ncbi:MAG: hypothetical protein AMXMBFR83_17740 [Phycisphaerae bacterium]
MASSQTYPTSGQPFAGAPVANPFQLGGIETSVLDNGPGRGVRIAWVNTGGGLRYKVVLDRGLDVADAEFLGQSLTWHSLTGITAPRPAYGRGLDWLKGFYGGLLVSCGPLNTGGPFVEDGVEYGLHGTHSNTPAILEAIVNPDPSRGQYEMSITALVRTARVFNPNVELRRTLSSTLGSPSIRVRDVFTNRGNEPVEHAWLLHINFGYPLLEPGASTYCYGGRLTPLGESAAWFAPGNDYRSAPEPMSAHRGSGEFFTYIDPPADPAGQVVVGVVNRRRGFGVRIEYSKAHYPRLGNWQHWAPGEYTGALEPMTAGVEGRPIDRQRGWLRTLQPDETLELACTITAVSDPAELDRLLGLNR